MFLTSLDYTRFCRTIRLNPFSDDVLRLLGGGARIADEGKANQVLSASLFLIPAGASIDSDDVPRVDEKGYLDGYPRL